MKPLEQQYVREQLRRAGTPGPQIIGIDEVSIRKRHNPPLFPNSGANPKYGVWVRVGGQKFASTFHTLVGDSVEHKKFVRS